MQTAQYQSASKNASSTPYCSMRIAVGPTEHLKAITTYALLLMQEEDVMMVGDNHEEC